MAVADATLTALELADSERRAGPFRLWQLANAEAEGHRAQRQTLFRHAMIHAGFLLTAKGGPYKRCRMCHRALKR